MNKTAKKIWDIATTALVVLVVILATLLVGARFIGLTPFTVLSGSMEPTYHVGSLIYVKKVDPYTLEAGDVITYSISEEMQPNPKSGFWVLRKALPLPREAYIQTPTFFRALKTSCPATA